MIPAAFIPRLLGRAQPRGSGQGFGPQCATVPLDIAAQQGQSKLQHESVITAGPPMPTGPWSQLVAGLWGSAFCVFLGMLSARKTRSLAVPAICLSLPYFTKSANCHQSTVSQSMPVWDSLGCRCVPLGLVLVQLPIHPSIHPHHPSLAEGPLLPCSCPSPCAAGRCGQL